MNPSGFGGFLPGGGGQRGVDIAVFIDMGVRQAEIFQFLDQLAGQIELAGRAGVGAGVGV